MFLFSYIRLRLMGKSRFRFWNPDFGFQLREFRPQGGFQLRNPNPDFIDFLYTVRLGNPKRVCKTVLVNSGLLFANYACVYKTAKRGGGEGKIRSENGPVWKYVLRKKGSHFTDTIYQFLDSCKSWKIKKSWNLTISLSSLEKCFNVLKMKIISKFRSLERFWIALLASHHLLLINLH